MQKKKKREKKKPDANPGNFHIKAEFRREILGPSDLLALFQVPALGDYSIYLAFPREIISCFSVLLALNETPSMWAFRLLVYTLFSLIN